ncbi:MAG: hypothetical protein ACI9VS_002598 [Candidatus Binatia bacterium]|jgi:hypothetical protein
MNPLKFILLCLAGWIQREQQDVIEYLKEEIRVLKEIHKHPIGAEYRSEFRVFGGF